MARDAVVLGHPRSGCTRSWRASRTRSTSFLFFFSFLPSPFAKMEHAAGGIEHRPPQAKAPQGLWGSGGLPPVSHILGQKPPQSQNRTGVGRPKPNRGPKLSSPGSLSQHQSVPVPVHCLSCTPRGSLYQHLVHFRSTKVLWPRFTIYRVPPGSLYQPRFTLSAPVGHRVVSFSAPC